MDFRVTFQAVCNLGRIGHALRRQNHQQTVAIGIVGGDFERLGIALRIGVSENVDWVVMAPVSWEKLIQSFQSFFGEHRELPPIGDERIGSEDSRSAGIGDNGEPWSFRTRLLAENFRHIEQVGNAVNPQDAGAPEGGIENFVASCKRPGVRCCDS